jgi:hypothetical protein
MDLFFAYPKRTYTQEDKRDERMKECVSNTTTRKIKREQRVKKKCLFYLSRNARDLI